MLPLRAKHGLEFSFRNRMFAWQRKHGTQREHKDHGRNLTGVSSSHSSLAFWRLNPSVATYRRRMVSGADRRSMAGTRSQPWKFPRMMQ